MRGDGCWCWCWTGSRWKAGGRGTRRTRSCLRESYGDSPGLRLESRDASGSCRVSVSAWNARRRGPSGPSRTSSAFSDIRRSHVRAIARVSRGSAYRRRRLRHRPGPRAAGATYYAQSLATAPPGARGERQRSPPASRSPAVNWHRANAYKTRADRINSHNSQSSFSLLLPDCVR